MRKSIVAGNWKMNLLAHQATEVFNEIQHYTSYNPINCRVVIFPTHIYLPALQANSSTVQVGAQNISAHEKGAFTGEISIHQLNSVGISRTLIGHSERRSLFHENDEDLNQKLKLALSNDMEVFFCMGESLEERKSGSHFDTVKSQLVKGLRAVSIANMKNVVIAYEPVWAIGTGETASPEQAQEMHQFIRKELIDLYDDATAQNCSILYGGSVKPSNAKELFSNPDVDGGLVGGASLDAEDFISIIEATAK